MVEGGSLLRNRLMRSSRGQAVLKTTLRKARSHSKGANLIAYIESRGTGDIRR